MNKSKDLMVRMGLIETINYDTMTLDERIDFYRKKSKQCDNINENVMDIYYNIKSNNHKPLVIEKITLDRVINKHGKNGLIILSANRFNKSEEENIKNNQELINFIKQNNYSFLPTYGGYRNSETGEIGDYEPSYIVFNYDLNGNSRDFNELKEFGMKMCRQFEQDCITIKEPNKAAYWIDANGNKVNANETDKVYKNSNEHEYFTTFTSKERTQDLEKKYNKPYNGRKFTYDIIVDEVYVNPLPCTLNEQQRRDKSGEIMIFK